MIHSFVLISTLLYFLTGSVFSETNNNSFIEEVNLLLEDPISPTKNLGEDEYFLELKQIFNEKKEDKNNFDYLTDEEAVTFEKHGYVERILNIDAIIRLQIDKNTLSFDPFIKNGNQIDSANISVETEKFIGYQLFIEQIKPMSSSSVYQIPKTTCDKSTPCTVRKANNWIKNDSGAGFGFNLIGNREYLDFYSENYYRPFSDTEPISIYRSNLDADMNRFKLTIKAAVPDAPDAVFNGKIALILVPY